MASLQASNKLSKLVEESNLTYTEIAARVGISKPLLSMILSGQRNLTLENARKFASILDVEWYELYD